MRCMTAAARPEEQVWHLATRTWRVGRVLQTLFGFNRPSRGSAGLQPLFGPPQKKGAVKLRFTAPFGSTNRASAYMYLLPPRHRVAYTGDPFVVVLWLGTCGSLHGRKGWKGRFCLHCRYYVAGRIANSKETEEGSLRWKANRKAKTS